MLDHFVSRMQQTVDQVAFLARIFQKLNSVYSFLYNFIVRLMILKINNSPKCIFMDYLNGRIKFMTLDQQGS